MEKRIYKKKIIQLNRIINNLNSLRNVPWYYSLMKSKDDSVETYAKIKKEISFHEIRFRIYRSRVIQYISIFNQKANYFQKLNIDYYLEKYTI